MSEVATVNYFARKANQVLGTGYSGGSWESQQVINVQWLCAAVRKVYNDIHTNQSSAYHTKFLSTRFGATQASKIVCDKIIVNNAITYLLGFKGVCTCALSNVPTTVCGTCATTNCGVCANNSIYGDCKITSGTSNCTCKGDCPCNCTSNCECDCVGKCECNCNCQCECTGSGTDSPTTFCQCNCALIPNCMKTCECNCNGVCTCNCLGTECNCNCQCNCACNCTESSGNNCRPSH